jgi:hypothetical protein
MVFYVAAIAILNLCLGYVLAMYMGAGRSRLATEHGDSFDSLDRDEAAAE